jgi:hypothetical protein
MHSEVISSFARIPFILSMLFFLLPDFHRLTYDAIQIKHEKVGF